MQPIILLAFAGLALAACSAETPSSAERAPATSAAVEIAAQSTSTALRDDAAGAVQRFGRQLQGELQQAMAEGGPLQAVRVCQLRAPAIADELSGETGFQLARVSLKHRNPERGQPSDWQREVLESFDRRLAAGTPASELTFSSTARGEYRFMKAIPAAPLCLTCHGTAIEPTLQAELAALYPQDLATGYQAGQLRGAFVALRTIDSANRK